MPVEHEHRDGPLGGLRAVVTGVSTGIGQATAIALAEAGADVAGIHLGEPEDGAETAAAIAAVGRRTILHAGDVSRAGDLERLAGAVVDAWGGIDIWVNNAAQLLTKPFLETTDGDWDRLLGTNLRGYVTGCRLAARQMAGQDGGGRILNVASVVAAQPIVGLSAYVTAKGAVIGLTRQLAVELGPLGITVNAISPGATDTPLNRDVYTAPVRRAYEARIPLGRIGGADEVAGAIVMLAGPGARYVNGQNLQVDGGLTLNGSVGDA